MKAIIVNTDQVKHIVQVQQIKTPAGYTHLKFSTQSDRKPCDHNEQTKFEMFLTQQQLANLKDLL